MRNTLYQDKPYLDKLSMNRATQMPIGQIQSNEQVIQLVVYDQSSKQMTLTDQGIKLL